MPFCNATVLRGSKTNYMENVMSKMISHKNSIIKKNLNFIVTFYG